MKEQILSYAKPKTKEQVLSNLVYLLRENEEMKNKTAFTLDTYLRCDTDNVRWKFLEEITPKLNEYFNKLWNESQLKSNELEIKRLEEMLKNIL